MTLRPSIPLWLCLGLCAAPAWAEVDWSLCPAPPEYTAPQIAADVPAGSIEGSADSLSSLGQQRLRLEGSVVLETREQRVAADLADYDQSTGNIELRGNVRMESSDMFLGADSGQYNQALGTGGFTGADYRLLKGRGNGRAQSVLTPQPGVTELNRAVYTTCDPEQPEWAIHAAQLKLDRLEGMGTAKHLRLHLLDVPVFYWPYITFPIDDRRKSGLLFPSFATSSDNGFEFRQPVYWNIAPQADATLAPRYLEKRGTQAQLELRYLDRIGSYQLDGEFLDDRALGEERWLSGFRHSGKLDERWFSYARTRRVSDGEYLNDLGSNLSIGKPQHLKSEGGVIYRGPHWNHQIGTDYYQTLDQDISASDRPHHREPFVRSVGHSQWQGLDLRLDTEWVNFAHDTRVNGQRLDLYPSLSHRFGDAGWFATPKLGLRHTRYTLEDLESTSDETPSRTTGIASLDMGLILERAINGRYTQTLEPRIYGLYVPEEDQAELPLFDTAEFTFSYDQLFRENRFTGADRQGDTRQVSAGLTTRINDDESGTEKFSLGVGQIFYLADREVTLAETGDSETRSSSDIVTQSRLQIDRRWILRGNWQYNPEVEQTAREAYSIAYQAAPNRIVNLGYREVAEELEQSELSLAWAMNSRWTLYGRWLYNLQENQSQETFAGAEYQSCCWAVSLLGRRVLEDGEFDREIMLQFTLRGLASLGDDTERLLERAILGYEED